jgi:hypothetical protein
MKKVYPPKPTGQRRELSRSEIRSAIRQLELDTARAEAAAIEHRARARRQMSAIVQDLMPVAAKLARKGRGRLLAVLARILQDEKMDKRSAEAIRKIAATR